MPDIVENEMVNTALDNLHAEKTADGSPMQPRKAGSKRNQGRRILLDTGDGDRSIRGRQNGNVITVEANEYMVAHNEGATIAGTFSVRAHTRRRRGKSEEVGSHTRTVNIKLPERTFLAPGKQLYTRIQNALESRLKALLK